MVFSSALFFRDFAQYFLDLGYIRTENSEHGKDPDRDKNNGCDNNYRENSDVFGESAHCKTSVYPSTHLVAINHKK